MTVLFAAMKSIFYLITCKLKFPKKYRGKIVCMEDGLKFKIFRHMRLAKKGNSGNGTLFIVRFKFKKFSHKTNMRTSIIPIPLIAGFKGFRDKIWMIDWENGYWQGMYQWDNESSVEQYKKSFVLGIMNKRSIEDSLSYTVKSGLNFEQYVEALIIE